jgi:hypothetical protein
MSDALDTWQWRHPLPQGNPIDGIAWGNGRFAAVSRAGTIMTSSDATSWDLTNVGIGLSAIRYLSNLFVAVGNGGSILTSPDGTTWTTQSSGASHALLDVARGNNLFVAVGQCDAIVTSPDGAAWLAGSSGIAGKESEKFYGVAFGNGVFVVVGLNGTIIISSDGVTWTDRSWPGGDDVVAVAFGAGRFVAACNNGLLLTSTNGVAWTSATPGGVPGCYSVDFVNGMFVAVGKKVLNNAYVGVIWTSSNGLAWSEKTSGVSEALFGTAYGNGMYMIGGYWGTVLTSPDGTTWNRRNSDTSSNLNDIAYGNGTFVAVGGSLGGPDGASRHPAVFRSVDVVTWLPVTVGVDEPLYGVVYTGSETSAGMFVAVGGYGSVLTSYDGASWISYRTNGSFLALARHETTLVGVGAGGVMRSVDFLNWVKINPGTGRSLYDVAWGEGKFVAVGESGTIVTSTDDGQTWSQASSGSTDSLRGVAYGNGIFVAVGVSGEVLTSPDAQAWTQQGLSLGSHVYKVIHSAMIPGGSGGFLALGSDGRMATSPDGVTWTARNSGTSNGLLAAAYGNGSFIAVGGGCTILQAQIFAPLSLKALTPSLKSPQRVGTRVVWDCAATGRPGLRYAFSVARAGLNLPGPPREKLQFQSQPRFVQILDRPGTYIVTAWVKDAEGNLARKNSAPFVVKTRALVRAE